MLALEKSNPAAAKKVEQKIKSLANNPRPPDAAKMRGQKAEYLRIYAGKYRIIYLPCEDELLIAAVGNRNDAAVYKEFMRQK